jgi:streptogramin lyase
MCCRRVDRHGARLAIRRGNGVFAAFAGEIHPADPAGLIFAESQIAGAHDDRERAAARRARPLNSVTAPAGARPIGIIAGPDGNLWFCENAANKVGRIAPSGIITEFPVPTPGAGPNGIMLGPDGNLWFSETEASQIGR